MPANPPAFKAEIILAIQLVTRHRAFRLTSGLAGLTVLSLRLAPNPPAGSVVAVAGALGAIAGSRVLARGPAMASARAAAAPVRSVIGRFVGVMLVLAPIVMVGGVLVGGGEGTGVTEQATWSVAYAAVLAAVSMGGVGAVGASSVSTFGVFAAWVGQVPPETWAERLGVVGGLTATIWSVLPMAWRVGTVTEGDRGATAVLLSWMVMGLSGAVVAVRRRRRLA